MKIHRVKISNYRALQDVDIKFSDVTTFIGKNGAGKSCILRALDWFFNATEPLTDQDCHAGNTKQNVEVTVTFDSLTSTDREKLGKYAPEGAELFTATKRRTPDGDERLSGNCKAFEPFNSVRNCKNVKDMKAALIKLNDTHPDLELPKPGTKDVMIEAMESWEANNPDELTDTEDGLDTEFFGFIGKGKISSLFNYVFISADLRAEDEAADAKATVLGRILERTIDRSEADEELERIVEKAQNEQHELYQKTFGDKLALVEKQLTEAISVFARGRSVQVRPAPLELKTPRAAFEPKILDGDTETPVHLQGHGFQRTLLIAALQVLAESNSIEQGNVICLAIEEPELYQHPTQERAFARVLRSLAEETSRGVQVTYATHSPTFLESGHIDQIRCVIRDADSRAVTIKSTSVGDISKEWKHGEQNNFERRAGVILTKYLARAVFANRVILVEGTSDAAILTGLGDRKDSEPFEVYGTEVAVAEGKGSLRSNYEFLKALGIPTLVVFDGDKVVHHGTKGEPCTGEKDETKARRENQALAATLSLELVDGFPGDQFHGEAATFNDTLETYLSREWPEWHLELSKAEREYGHPAKKLAAVYAQATALAEGDVPTVLADIEAWAKAQ